MTNLRRNTTAVLVLTLFTGLAVFTAIQLGDRLFATSSASAQTSGAQSAETLNGSTHAYGQSGGNGYGYGQRSSGSGQSGSGSYSDPYGQGDSGSGGGQTYTCPATGCSASSCHATQQ